MSHNSTVHIAVRGHVCLQVRFMVRKPLQVGDDSTNEDGEDDDLDLVEGAAATGTAAGGAAPTESLAGPAVEKKKSVRLAAEGECRALCKYSPGSATSESAVQGLRLSCQHHSTAGCSTHLYAEQYMISLAARGVSAVAST